MADNNQIGITVAEGIANGLNLGSGVSTRNIGLLMERERGVPKKAFLLTNQDDDRRIFGAVNRTMYSPLVLDSFFRNLGGFNAQVFGIRLVGAASLAATAVVAFGAPAVTLMTLKAGNAGSEDPGTWGNSLRVVVYPKGHPNGQRDKYQLDVLLSGRRLESFTNASLVVLAQDINRRSGYVLVSGAVTAATPALTAPIGVNFAGGTYASPLPAAYEPANDAVTGEPLGMALFTSMDVQIVACPEVFTPEFNSKCVDWARTHDKFYVYSLPFESVESNLTDNSALLATPERGFSAGYLEWAEVDDRNSGRMWIPAIGYVLAAGYIRTAALNNNAVWTPPAGADSRSVSIFRFTHPDLSDQTRDRYARQFGVNTIKFIRGRGFTIWTSRTNSTESLFASIHISLLTNWLKESLNIRSTRFLQKLNSPSLRTEIKLDHSTFMRNVYEKGGLENSVPFEQACAISVTQSPEDRRNITEVIEYIPTESTESIKINLNRNDGVLVLQG